MEKDITVQQDRNGCNLLHSAASLSMSTVVSLFLDANPSAAYQPDKNGLFPVHIAALEGELQAVITLLKKCPECVNLCDSQGRTFLHVAVQKKKQNIVSYACRTPSLAPILNAQDNEGNTALHLAVQVADLSIVCALMGNQQVCLDILNSSGQTPKDLSWCRAHLDLFFHWNPQQLIYNSLEFADTGYNLKQWDLFKGQCTHQPENERDSWKILDSSTPILAIGSILAATVAAFGAAFALPGGYRADDHPYSCTPILAGRYTFDAFIMAITLSIAYASVSVISVMFAGLSMVDLSISTRQLYISNFFMFSSVTCIGVAFALGLYTVLAPVAQTTAVTVFVVSFAVMLIEVIGPWQTLKVARAVRIRSGNKMCVRVIGRLILDLMFLAFWPFIIIFGWAAYSAEFLNGLSRKGIMDANDELGKLNWWLTRLPSMIIFPQDNYYVSEDMPGHHM